MVLRLRVRICFRGKCVEGLGIANSGFVSEVPEVVIPDHMARELLPEGYSLTLVSKVLADGTRTYLPRTVDTLDLYLITEDRTEGPIKVYAYLIRCDFILLSDSTLSALRVAIIDPKEGLWCFRDELGRKVRRGY